MEEVKVEETSMLITLSTMGQGKTSENLRPKDPRKDA
jgi:hypothetical protein